MKNATKILASLAAGLTFGIPVTGSAQTGPATTFTYSDGGKVTSVTTPGGRTRQLQWDLFGRNVQQSQAGVSVGFGYNHQDALTAVQDQRGLTTSYARNGFGEATSQTAPDTGGSSYTYDANGNLNSRVNAAGQTETFSYDAGNRVVGQSITHPTSGAVTYSFVYGTSGAEAGQLVQVSGPGLTLSYAHNLYGQVTTASQALSGTATLTTSYGYANNGAPTSITYPSGRVVTLTLDGVSRVSGITVDGASILSGVSYSPLGAVTGWAFAGGQSVARTFDANARLTSVTMPWGARQFVYDVDDRIVGINDSLLGNAVYAYDNFDRLVSASNAAGSWTYQYDASGNRTGGSVNGSSYGTSVDTASNRMLAAGQWQNTFTADGQTAQVANGPATPACGPSLTLGYQADGQLVTSNVLSAVHAPNGLRLQKTAAACAGGAKTNFVYDTAGHLIGEYDALGAVIQETVWLGDLPVAVFRPGSGSAPFYVYADNLGTPRGVTTAGGVLVWSWDGEPFGASPAIGGQLGQQGAFRLGLRFPGQYLDEETGYHHNGWREYDPALGRYVQSDPIGLAGGLNTYAYVESDPLAHFDEAGLYRSSNLLRGAVPGQISFDNAITNIENGQYGYAALNGAAMLAEQLLWAATLVTAQTGIAQSLVAHSDDLVTVHCIKTNSAAGAAWEAEAIEKLKKIQNNIRPQITVKSNGPSGVKVRLDAVGQDKGTGAMALSDMKASPTAPLTKNQKVGYPEIEVHGGTVVGQGKPPYTGGTPIPPTKVELIIKQ